MNTQYIETAPEPSYRHGLKIRIIPELTYKDIAETQPARITADCEYTTAGDIVPFLLDQKDKQYYTDILTADTQFITLDAPEKTIRITIDSDSPARTVLCITAKPQTKTTLVITHTGSAIYDAASVSIYAEEGATVNVIVVQTLETAHSFKNYSAKVQKDATVTWTAAITGSTFTQASFVNLLEGSGATGTSTVLYLAKDKEQYDIETLSIHRNKETYSDIVTKGAVTHSGKALSRGLVRIEENAFGSNGYEKQDALILSRTAEADAIPNLEIHNHDVKCSHGSTIGQVDESKLFYLMSRGMSKDAATATIVQGFFNPVLETLDEITKEHIQKNIEEGLVK